MSLAIKGDIVVFGKDGAVREVLETLAGKRKPVTTEPQQRARRSFVPGRRRFRVGGV